MWPLPARSDTGFLQASCATPPSQHRGGESTAMRRVLGEREGARRRERRVGEGKAEGSRRGNKEG